MMAGTGTLEEVELCSKPSFTASGPIFVLSTTEIAIASLDTCTKIAHNFNKTASIGLT